MRKSNVGLLSVILSAGLAIASAAAAPADRSKWMAVGAVEKPSTQVYALKLRSKTQTTQALEADLAQASPGVKLRWRSKFWPDIAVVEGPADLGSALSRLPSVQKVQIQQQTKRAAVIAHGAKLLPRVASAVKTVEIPLSADPLAGKGIKVAILSTGIDYTHAALGGAGTAAAYADALANETAPYDGFPTAVVVGGLDLAPEATFLEEADHNPLDSNIQFSQPGYTFPTGRGTYLASIVHRLAPGAKLVALKAYGIWQDHGRTFTKDPTYYSLGKAFEAALDPNNDGDTSDHVDVLLLDDSYGGLSFYDPARNDPTLGSVLQDMVQDLTAHGVAVICTSGDLIFDAPYSIADTGAVPDALTVGGLDGNTVAAFSGRGPVRGTARYLKPELVSDATQIAGATVGSGGASELRTTTDAAAARIAAAVAILKAQRPALSAIELKAALANTANRQIYQDALHAQQPADISRAGLGRENVDAAARTQITLWDDDTRQPSLFLGFHEVTGSERYVRQLRVRNLSDSDQTFTMSTQKVGDKPGFAALTVESPATVHVPAHGSTLVPVVFTVDATKLPAWTMREKGQFSDDSWSQAELSGYLVLSQQGQPDVAVSWMLMARPRTQIAKLSATYAQTFNSAFWMQYTGLAGTLEERQDFRNDNPSPVRFATYPVIARIDMPNPNRGGYDSDQIHYVGGSVFDEPRCSSGKKLSVAMSLFQPTPLALSNDFNSDVGIAVFRWGLFPDPTGNSTDAFVAIGEVALDEQGQPTTYYVNPAAAADPTQPQTFMVSKLPARMASHTRNIVSEVCLDEIYHDSFNSLAAFNANLSWTFLTDGDAAPSGRIPLTYNPVQGGYAALLKQPGQADSAFVPEADANAGVSLNLGAATTDFFSSPFSTGPTPQSAGPQSVTDGFLLLSLNDDFMLFSPVGLSQVNIVSSPRAGQVFLVREDATAGTVVGHIETDVEQFFSHGQSEKLYSMTLTNAVPGDSLAVQPNGDIVVANAAGLNPRLDPVLTLSVRGSFYFELSRIVDVTVRVTSAHNAAPVYSGDKSLPDAATRTPYQFALSNAFSDPDGNPLRYSAQGLPNGLSVDSTGGTISGTPAQSGDFKVTVTANDGFQTTSVPLDLTVRSTDAPASGGGGALSPLGLLLLGLCGFLRLAQRSGKRWWLPLLAAVSLSAHAAQIGEEPAKPLPRNANAAQPVVPEVLRDSQGRNLYFLQFQDAPLARYDGEVKGLPATSLQATAGRNVTRSGTLDVQSASSQNYLAHLQNQQGSALQAVASRLGYAVQPKERFSIALNAVTAYLTPAEAQKLAGLPQLRSVKRILPSKLLTDRGPSWIGAPQVWAGVAGSAGSQGEGVIVGIIDTGITPSAPSFAAVGGDGYHHQNPLGSGVYLGDCVAKPQLCNDKLIGVVSYPDITSAYQGQRPAEGVDHDGHGSHTASTVAGNVLKNVTVYNGIGQPSAQTFPQISGVAPHANIIAYQVCYPGTTGPASGCLPYLTVRAVEHAIQHGVKVLNYSIGGPAESPWSSTDGQAFLSARAAGIHVAVAAGNDGPAAETVSSPGNAPWVTTAAASSHDRGYTAKTLGGFSGGTPPPATISGKGVTSGYTGTVVSAADHGDALCLNPFASGTYSGQIVVCQRGQNARVAKGANVLAGGAGGMILINVDDKANDVVEDYHALPAIHVDKADGAAILQWLSSGSGATHAATISNSVLAPTAAAADIVADFSSRGPSYPYADWIKPDLAAPGVNIYAAYSPDQLFQNPSYPAPYAFLSGTSMATPHTAGTLALIAALHPDWTPAEAQSALVMTAQPVLRTARGAAANLFDGGNGRIDAAAAVQAALVLNETAAHYNAARPPNGSSTPGPMNLPSLVSANCVLQCTWTRTVRATRSGSYSAGGTVSDSGAAIAVSPANFSLAAGQTQQLTISLNAVGQTSNVAVSGIVALTPADSSSPTLRLPMTARLSTSSVPALTHIEASANQGTQPIDGLSSSAAKVQYGLNGWTIAQRYPAKLTPDPRFGQTGNQQVVPLEVTASTRLLVVSTLDGTAADLDLYIAPDKRADGKFDPEDLFDHLLCTRKGPGTDKQCMFVNPTPGSYVIVVHDVQGQASGDTHTLVVAQVKDTVDGLSMNGPTAVAPGQPFAANIGWNLPKLQSDDLAYALFSVEQTNGTPDIGPFGIVELHRVIDPLLVTADASDILSGTNITYTLHLAAATAATAVDVDLPSALSLVSAEGNPAISGNHLSWNLASGNGTTLKLVVGTTGVTQTQNVALKFAYSQGSSAGANASAPPVLVEGYPVARIAGAAAATLQAKAGDSLSLDTSGSTGALDSDTLQFSWHQVSGPDAPVTGANGSFSLNVPGAAAGQTLRYELVVSNGRRNSVPATLEVDVASNSSGGGGGAMGWPLLIAMLMALTARRVVKPDKA